MKSQILQRLEPSEGIEQLERLEQALTSKEAVMESNVIQQRVPVSSDTGHWVHVSDSPRHVRVLFGGETIADSKRVKLVREAEILPAYYFPKADVPDGPFHADPAQEPMSR